MAFLDVLGYSDDTVRKNGFVSQYELAEHTYDYIDLYYNTKNRNSAEDSKEIPITRTRSKQKIVESLEYMAPWIGSLILRIPWVSHYGWQSNFLEMLLLHLSLGYLSV